MLYIAELSSAWLCLPPFAFMLLTYAEVVCSCLQGSKVFCLQYVSMQTIDIPQTSGMSNYLQRQDFANAYKVACLGVTDEDWRSLAFTALQVCHPNNQPMHFRNTVVPGRM